MKKILCPGNSSTRFFFKSKISSLFNSLSLFDEVWRAASASREDLIQCF